MDQIETKLGEVEDLLYENDEIQAEMNIYDVSMEGADNESIEVEGVRIIIPELGYSARFGEYLIYDEEADAYEADFSLTLIYDIDEKAPDKYLYWEQDGIVIALYNYQNQMGKKKGVDDLGSIKCVVEVDP